MNVPLMLNVLIMASLYVTLHQIPMYVFNVWKIPIVLQMSLSVISLTMYALQMVSTLNKVIKGKMIKLLMHFELKVNNDFFYDQTYRYLDIHAHPKCGGVSHDVYLTHCHEAFNHGLLLVCYWLFGWHGCE